MSTNKDGSKERTSSKRSLSKRESSTDRTNNKAKKEPQKTKTKEDASSKSLTKSLEEHVKPKKSNTSTKVTSKKEKVSSTSTKISSRASEKESVTSSRKIPSSKPPEKEILASSRKISSKLSEKELSASTKIPSEKELLASSRKISSKLSEKELLASSAKMPSKSKRENSTSSTKVPSNPEKVSSTTTLKSSSRAIHDITKPSSTNKTSSRKKSSTREVSATPYKDNIKKTQFFPSKNLYSNALKYGDIPENVLEDMKSSARQEEKPVRKSTKDDKVKNISSSKVIKASPRPLDSLTSVETNASQEASPDTNRKSVKTIKSKIKDATTREPSPDTSSVSERPRTATLRKGSIVNANIVGPEVPKPIKKVPIKENMLIKEQPATIKQKSPSPTNSDDNYEDDFESYESDFEAYSSSEDNTNLAKMSGEETSSASSGSDDIQENNDLYPKSPPSSDIKTSSVIIEEERTHDSGTFELPDFKHRRILDDIKESVEREHAVLQEERLKEKANLASLSDEGFEDQQSLQFINFAEARKKCEKKRLNDLRRKRGQEILGMIKLDNISFTIFDSPAVPYDVYISNYGQHNGVQASVQTGEDNISEEIQTEAIEVQIKWSQMPNKFSSFDQNQENFWDNYKNEYLGVGNDDFKSSLNKIEHTNEKRLTSFLNQAGDLISDLLAEANIGNLNKLNKNDREIPFSDGYLQFNTSIDIFKDTRVQNISVFSKNINHILTVHLKNDISEDFIKSIISIWDVSDFNAPRNLLVSYGEINCATFSLDVTDLIFAGQKDGAILVWNIKEKSKIYDIRSRTPTVTSGIGASHFTKVVSIQFIKENKENRGYFDKPENNEICSLDEDGDIIIWNIYTESKTNKSTSDMVLINTTTIKLQDLYPDMPDLVCSDFILSEKHVYVTTNYGFILHCILNVTGRNIKKFVPATPIEATCLEQCPFSSSFFLAGYSNGNITLYSRMTERPLMVLRNNEEIVNTSVQIIQWSKTKPFVLYAKDSRNSIHIWDLSKSDMYPEYSIPFREEISCLKLSPTLNVEQEETSYMLIGTENGKVYLHLLSKEYGQESYEDYKNHVTTFLNYVSRL